VVHSVTNELLRSGSNCHKRSEHGTDGAGQEREQARGAPAHDFPDEEQRDLRKRGRDDLDRELAPI
jgi:hypothetical protein